MNESIRKTGVTAKPKVQVQCFSDIFQDAMYSLCKIGYFNLFLVEC